MDWPQVYYSFTGRLNRQRFLFYWVGLNIVVRALTIGFDFITNNIVIVNIVVFSLIVVLSYLLAIGVLYCQCSLMVKRYHDMNKKWIYGLVIVILTFIIQTIIENIYSWVQSEWIYLLSFLPILLVLMELFFRKGTVWDNKYGKDPLEQKKT
jgi:uncharacterized membrane protein YhaH (DUF805 family)